MESQITLSLPNAGTPAEKNSLNCFRSLTGGNLGCGVVTVTRKWVESDLMFTHNITSVDLAFVDTQGDELHVVIPRNLIGRFADEITEGRLYSTDKLHMTDAKKKLRPTYSLNRGYLLWNPPSLL